MREPVDVTPLGPDSLNWRYAGDWRTLLLGTWVGLVQLSLPGLGAGVAQHSAFYTEPFDRFLRSVPQIAGVLYDGEKAPEQARRIRDLHRTFGGIDHNGARYHALNPDIYFWAHMTIGEVVVKMIDLFDHPITAAEKQQHHEEVLRTWQFYQIRMRSVPLDRAAAERYLADGYAHRLEGTPAVLEFIRMNSHPGSMTQPWLPTWLWRAVAPIAVNPMWLVGVGCLAPETRETLGLPWTSGDERKLRRFATAVRVGWHAVPRRIRYMPRAVAAFKREGWPAALRAK
jgi:uncharacterized protein (DUF2236 family)